MTNADRKQTWKSYTNSYAPEFGRVKYTTTEILDFDTLTCETRSVGTDDGERFDQKGSYTFAAECTPEGAAEYRVRNGYVRVA